MGITPQSIRDEFGVTRSRSEGIFIPEMGRMIPCAPYDEHFVYENAIEGQPSFKCTCGGAAVIANVDGTGNKLMLICLLHATTGRHTNIGDLWV